MFKTIRMKLVHIFVACALTIAFATQDASAADTVIVTQVTYDTGRLGIFSATSGYYGGISGCLNPQPVDTIKMWLSIAETALLSGKSLQIYFSTCSTGQQMISSLTLLK